jgi:hypothetical protein
MATTRKSLLAWSLLLVLALPGPTFGEKKHEPYALIFGTVYGPDHVPVRGVKIRIARMNGKEASKTWQHVSDGRGEFAQRVPAGTADYLVWADIKPPKGQPISNRPEVRVHVENDERQDIGLHLTR